MQLVLHDHHLAVIADALLLPKGHSKLLCRVKGDPRIKQWLGQTEVRLQEEAHFFLDSLAGEVEVRTLGVEVVIRLATFQLAEGK